MEIQIETITPEIASDYLSKNCNIRKIHQSRVRHWADTMRNGGWKLHHQGIAFDQNGNLVDGQHRLSAVVQSGVTVQMLVARGVECDAVPDMDLGQKRNFAVILGEPRKRVVEASAFLARLVFGNGTVKTRELQSIHKIIGPSSEQLIDACGSVRAALTSSSVKAAFAMMMAAHSYSASKYADWYRRLVLMNISDLETLAECPPSIRALHQRLALSTAKIHPLPMFAYAVRALRNPDTNRVYSSNYAPDVEFARTIMRELLESQNQPNPTQPTK